MDNKFSKTGTKKEAKPFEVLTQEDLAFVRGGDGDPPPVENGDDN